MGIPSYMVVINGF